MPELEPRHARAPRHSVKRLVRRRSDHIKDQPTSGVTALDVKRWPHASHRKWTLLTGAGPTKSVIVIASGTRQ